MKEANYPEWGASSFAHPKLKTDCIRFLRDFWNLNRQLKRKPYTMSKTCEMLLNSDGFQCATSLDLYMSYYHIRLIK